MGVVWKALALPAKAVEGTISLAAKLMELWPSFLFLYGAAYVFIILRWLCVHAPVVVELIFAVLRDVVVAVRLGWAIIAGVVDIVTFGFAHLNVVNPFPSKHSFFGGDWIDEVNDVGTDCQKFVDWQEVFGFYMGQATGKTLCAFLRFISPVPWLYDVFDPLLGWLTLDPNPQGNNCSDSSEDWLCAVLGTGYLILQLLIPVYLGILVFTSYRAMLTELFMLTLDALEFTYRLVFVKLLREGYTDFQDFVNHFTVFFTKRALQRRKRREQAVSSTALEARV